MVQPTFLKASYTKIDHYQCHLLIFASNLGIVIVGVYSTMKCRLHPLSQVECCVSHLSCRINHVAVTYDMCIHATHMTGDILRFIRGKTFLKKKSLTLG